MRIIIFKQKILHFSKIYPSCIILFALLLPLILLSIFQSNLETVLILLSAIFISLTFISFKLAGKVLFWCLIGCFLFQTKIHWLNSGWSSQFNTRIVRVDTKAVVCDTTATGNTFTWLKNPRSLIMKLREIKLSGTSDWEKTSDKIYVHLPDNINVRYGDFIEMSGFLSSPSDDTGQSFFKNYLTSLGIQRILQVKLVESIKPCTQFPYNYLRVIFSARDKAIGLCTAGFNDFSVKQFIAGLLFGCRQGISKNIKEDFLKTGTIHILAISGLHIGILALLLLVFFRWLPVRTRYLIVPLLLFLYVIIIGYRPSAVRAFIMIALYALHKAFFASVKPLNVLALAAVIMLLINPFAVLNIGFVYSFVIVGFLILSTNIINGLVMFLYETSFWKPEKLVAVFSGFKYSINRKFIVCFAGSFIAGLAAMPIQLFSSGLFIPFMPVINMLVIPLLFPLFILIGIKLVFSSFLSTAVINIIIAGIIHFIFNIVHLSSQHIGYFYLDRPMILLVILFYVCLCWTLINFRKRKAFAGVVMLIIIMCGCGLSYFFNQSKLIVYKPAGNATMSFIIKQKFTGHSVLVNCPMFSAYKLTTWMKSAGIHDLDTVYLSKSNQDFSGGVLKLIDNFPVKEIIFSNDIRKNKLYKRVLEKCKNKKISISYADFSKFSYNKKTYKLPAGGQIALSLEVDTINPGYGYITVKVNNRRINRAEFKATNRDKFIPITI